MATPDSTFWHSTGGFESQEFSNSLDDIGSVVSAIGTTLGAVSDLISEVAKLIQFAIDLLDNIVKALIKSLINFIEDFLNSGLAGAVHINTRNDPDWKLSDWTKRGEAPLTGNGLEGWFLDLALSAKNPRNPMAPNTDRDQPVAMLAVLWGADLTALNSLSGIIKAVSTTTQMYKKEELMKQFVTPLSAKAYCTVPGAINKQACEALGGRWVEPKSRWEEWLGIAEFRKYARLGGARNAPALTSLMAKATDESTSTWQKLSETTGVGQGSYFDQDAYGQDGEQRKLIEEGLTKYFYAPNGVSSSYLSEIKRDELEVLKSEGRAPLPTILTRFARGNPIWAKITVGDIIGRPFVDLLKALQELLSLFNKKRDNPLTEWLNNLARYLERLDKLAQMIAKFITLIDDLIESLTKAHICVVPYDAQNHSTGLEGAISRAIRADGKPDFGPDGIVFGFAGIVQGFNAEDIWSKIKMLMSLFKMDFGSLWQEYAQQWDDVFTECGTGIQDAWTNTPLLNNRPYFTQYTAPDGSVTSLGGDQSPFGEGQEHALQVATATTAVGTAAATDPNSPAQTLTFSLPEGRDKDLFEINPSTGALIFTTAPEYASPTDHDENNVYEVVIQVTNGTRAGLLYLKVHVNNV